MLGCSGGVSLERGTTGEEPGQRAQAIIGGTVTTDYPAVGHLAIWIAPEWKTFCTASLVAEDVIVTAAHCVVRISADEESTGYGQHCAPKLGAIQFVDSAGTAFPIDTGNARAYVPGQTFEQMADSDLGCTGGARDSSYYTFRHGDDIALLGLVVSGAPPASSPVPLWTSPTAPVETFLDQPFTWLGRRGGTVTKLAQASDLSYASSLADACEPSQSATRFLAKEVPCSIGEAASGEAAGWLEPGDSGGPLLVTDSGHTYIAGTNQGYGRRRVDGQCGSGGTPYACNAREEWYNYWSSVPANADFLKDALEDARTDYDRDGVGNDLDNCPAVPNLEQANWNLEYELEHNSPEKPPLGNACDPSPVARAYEGPPEIGFSASSYLTCNKYTDDLAACAARRYRYEMDLSTTWSKTDLSGSETVATTGTRYCICTNPDGSPMPSIDACKLIGCRIANRDFALPEAASADDQYTVWRRQTLYRGEAQVNSDGTIVAGTPWNREEGESMTYADGTHADGTLTWDWPLDAASWKAAGYTKRGQNLRQEPLGGMGKPEDRPAPGNRKACPCEVYWSDPSTPPAGAFPDGADIPGLVWVHNDSWEGIGDHRSDAPCGTGVSDTCGFGNAYSFFAPAERTYACPYVFDPEREFTQIGDGFSLSSSNEVFLLPRYQPPATSVVPMPLVSEVRRGVSLPFAPIMRDGSPIHASFSIPCGTTGATLAQLDVAGTPATVITHAFPADVIDAVVRTPSLLWAAPSEPAELFGASFPLSIALDRSSGTLVAALQPSEDGTIRLDAAGRPRLASNVQLGPPASLGPLAYSRVRGEVAQLEASDPLGALDTIRVTPVLFGIGSERSLAPASLRPSVGYAAAYAFDDRRLWTVASLQDDPTCPWPMRGCRYLMGIDTATGGIEAVRRLMPELRKFWLTVSERSELVMVAAPDSEPWHLVAVFAPERADMPAGAELIGLARRSGQAVAPARVSGGAVAKLMAGPGRKPKLGRNDPSRYHVEVTPLNDIRGRIQGQCFHPAQGH